MVRCAVNRDERHAARIALGRDALLTEAVAVELIPVGDAKARKWLRRRRLVHDVPELGRCVIWGEVLDAIRAERERATRPAPTPSTLPRKNLRRSGAEEAG